MGYDAQNVRSLPMSYGSIPQQTSAPATFLQRLAAHLIDGLIVGVVVNIVSFVVGLIIGATLGGISEKASEAIAQLVGGLIGIVLGWLYYALLESSPSGATPGKKVLGLQVVDNDGYGISFSQATGRYFSHILSGLLCGAGYLAMLFSPEKKTWHDQLSNTRVIDPRR